MTVEQVLKIARKELNVKEYPPESNNVKYNTWFYGKAVVGLAYPWCMAFVQWVFNKAGQRLPYKTASCSALLNWYQSHQAKSVFKTAQPGDIVIYNFGHTGIVESISKDSITAIEGNTSISGSQSNGGMVCRQTRNLNKVTAFIRPDYEEEDMDISKLTDKDILALANRIQEVLGKQPVSSALSKELSGAKLSGITDGTKPNAFCTRAQAAVMASRMATSFMKKTTNGNE